jgi:hypothetical protein
MDWTWSYGLSRFRDRRDAGRQLAARLHDYRGRPDVLVLALPRGGVPVLFEVARALEAPLELRECSRTHRLHRPCYLAIRLCVLDSGWQRTGGARDQQGHCLQRGNDKESVQDSDPVADKADERRPGEGREFADG